MNDLSSKKCIPCEMGTPPLAIEKVQVLLKEVDGWFLIDKKIVKQYNFKNFKDSMGFVNKVGEIAEEEGHHPDISISYNKVKLELTTHESKGLTENDFILASKINNL